MRKQRKIERVRVKEREREREREKRDHFIPLLIFYMLHASIAENTRKTEYSKERREKENPTKAFIFIFIFLSKKQHKKEEKDGAKKWVCSMLQKFRALNIHTEKKKKKKKKKKLQEFEGFVW